jgi:hypothetical protein
MDNDEPENSECIELSTDRSNDSYYGEGTIVNNFPIPLVKGKSRIEIEGTFGDKERFMSINLWPDESHGTNLIPFHYVPGCTSTWISRREGGSWGKQGPKRPFDSSYVGENCPTNRSSLHLNIVGKSKPFHLTIEVCLLGYKTILTSQKNDS